MTEENKQTAEQTEDLVRVGTVSLEGYADVEKKPELVIDDGRIEAMREFQSPEELYQNLLVRIQRYHPTTDCSMIEHA